VLHQAIDLCFLPDYDSNAMVEFLLSRGAKKDIFIPLWLGDVAGVKMFLEQDPALVNARGPNDATPLCYASSVEMATLLLDHGADLFAHVRQPAQFDDTPIRWAAMRQDMFVKPNVLLLLLDRAGVQIDVFLACMLGDIDKVKVFISAEPALVHARTDTDHVLQPDLTPLHIAARYGHTAIATLLLDAGAAVNARAPAVKNMTPLHLAVWKGPRDVLRMLTDVPRLLLERGADVAARDSERNMTPLEWAEADDLGDELDRRDVATLLREYGAT
jgi:ankyrin repeat protein